MLDAKRIAFDRVDLIPAFSRVWLRLAGFEAGTVPALRLDGDRIQGSCAIARALEAHWPEPRLYPAEPAERLRIEEIEAWGDGPLQDVARRIVLWALSRSREGVRTALEGARLQFRVPTAVARVIAQPVLRLDAALTGAHASAVRADLASLPGMLTKIDDWIADGELGGDPPTAADYQIAGSVRSLLSFVDLEPLFADRPASALARRLVPAFPTRVPAGVLPPDWLSSAM